MRRALWLLSWLANGCVDPSCDPGALQAELASAQPGDVVQVGACEVEADLTVPPGVVLQGHCAQVTTERAADRAAVTLLTEAGKETTVENLRLESSSCAALVASGDGDASLRGATVVVDRGIGVGAERLRSLELTNVSVEGPLAGGSPVSVVRCRRPAVPPPNRPPTESLRRTPDGVRRRSLRSVP